MHRTLKLAQLMPTEAQILGDRETIVLIVTCLKQVYALFYV